MKNWHIEYKEKSDHGRWLREPLTTERNARHRFEELKKTYAVKHPQLVIKLVMHAPNDQFRETVVDTHEPAIDTPA